MITKFLVGLVASLLAIVASVAAQPIQGKRASIWSSFLMGLARFDQS